MSQEREPPGGGDASAGAVEQLSIGGQLQRAALERRLFTTAPEPIRIGRFIVLDVVGRGAMGTVYRGYDSELDRRIALKILATDDRHAQDKLRREALALARLAHPNIFTIHEVGEDGAGVYVAMEYVAGGTLGDWCARHPDPSRERTRQLLKFADQAIDGLIAARGARSTRTKP